MTRGTYTELYNGDKWKKREEEERSETGNRGTGRDGEKIAGRSARGQAESAEGTPEDARKWQSSRPFRVVKFGCRCRCGHFNSAEWVICVWLRERCGAGTTSGGIKWAPARFPTAGRMRTARCRALLPFLFSRMRQEEERGRCAREVTETNGGG
jgi:hypothetical protein